MSQQADLHYYTTSQTIADLILALDQLGYRQVNVFGVSYGTRTALELVRRHPQRVRSVALLGTYPPGRNGVLDAPMILDRSLGLLVAACVADDSCRQAYPELESSVARLSQLLESADAQAMPATRLEVASALRLLLFYPLTARQVPKILSAAANGDLSPLQAMTATAGSAFGGITDGAFLSLLCSEDIARIEPDQAEQVAAGTLLRGEWGKALISVCKEWTAAPLAEDFHSPLQTIVPILSLTGELDPSMPPSWGEEFAAEQPNARHLTIPEGQHGLLGMRGVLCVVELIESLIDRGNTEDLDATCLEQVQRPPFALP
jgi:pimeloyl-ACP methyl ester carboxylesterase